jgi:VanZ family protein
MAIERRVWRVVLAGACLGVLTLALLPTDRLPTSVFNLWDKAQHAFAFTLLGGLALRAFPRMALRALVGLAIFGGLIESAQWLVGWRSAEWADWVADIVGLLLALVLSRGTRRSTRG